MPVEPTAVAVARAHVEAWGKHDFDTARASLAKDVHVVATTVDPMPPKVDTTGADVYMEGLIQFAQGVLPGTTEVTSAVGDDARAMWRLDWELGHTYSARPCCWPSSMPSFAS